MARSDLAGLATSSGRRIALPEWVLEEIAGLVDGSITLYFREGRFAGTTSRVQVRRRRERGARRERV